MSDIYAKVGQTKRIFFLALTPATGAPDATLIAGSFTLKLGIGTTGNQATTGCTFGVLDATNNPGIYYIDCSGTTSFLATTGEYSIEVYVTATTSRIWYGTVRVTNDGTGAGTWGAAAFTPTAANGRVVSSAVALAGATVRILTSAGVLVYQTVSDASGLYPTTYYDTAGTYTISVQKSGYTITTGTLTISGSVATGPGTDLSITLSTTATGLLATDLWAYARRMLTDNTGSKADTEIRELVDEALAYLSMVKQWPFLETRGTVALKAVYTTGTVTITNGSATLTLASGTWPTWAASGIVYINNAWATVLTRDSNTQLTLAANWAEADVSASVYAIAQHAYTLPTDCMRISAVLFGQNWPYSTEVSGPLLESYRDIWQTSGSYPYCWAITASTFLVWPYPSAAHVVNLLYFRRPALLVSGTDNADWDPMQLMVLHRAIDYHASLRGECVAGDSRETRANLEDAIALAFTWDKTGDNRPLHTNLSAGFVDILRGPVS